MSTVAKIAGVASAGMMLFMGIKKAYSAYHGNEQEEEGKTMKKPGEDGRMLRRDFEENPKDYFLDHRRRQKLEKTVRMNETK
ncbi:hypothetical protein AMTR_s00063p00203350 [Amborella trichopoda]|uniref:Uncharacterized protein n=1 Tax=Amborella trichopoda TaxID=13333 RepID=U5D7F6_AMBTC|nr:hypothetical protein AMTR_s00063p00203350 [Amborella trichopoda]